MTHSVVCHITHLVDCRITHSVDCIMTHSVDCHISHLVDCQFEAQIEAVKKRNFSQIIHSLFNGRTLIFYSFLAFFVGLGGLEKILHNS